MVNTKKVRRALDFKPILEELQTLDVPVVVEGKRDTIALKKIGCTAMIIELNDGTSVLSTVERISQKFGRFITCIYIPPIYKQTPPPFFKTPQNRGGV